LIGGAAGGDQIRSQLSVSRLAFIANRNQFDACFRMSRPSSAAAPADRCEAGTDRRRGLQKLAG